MFWKDKKVLVTGADGYTGYHLCKRLVEKGAKVRGLVKTGVLKNLGELTNVVEIVKGDVLDYPSLVRSTRDIEVVFHGAAITLIPETRAMVSGTFNVNAVGTLNVLLASKENCVGKVVYISTCHVYGKQNNFPITEENIPMPIDIYSASKLAGEHICTSFIEMYGLDVSISRAFNHFGPRQREEFLIPTVITKLLRKEKLNLGDPKPTRDFSYVDDIVNGYILLAEFGKPKEIYQFCSGVEKSVKEIVETIVELAGFRSEVEWNPTARRVDISRSYGSYSKANKELGWQPRVSFEEGIVKTIDWFRRELEAPLHSKPGGNG